jgi:hypothetical protein
MTSPLAQKLASLPWQALAVSLFVLPTSGIFLTSHFAGGKGPSMRGGMPDMPVAAPPGATGAPATASTDGFDIMSARDWATLRDRIGGITIAQSPIGTGATRTTNQRPTQARPVASQSAQAAEDPAFPSNVQLTSVMRLATRGVVTHEVANANARAVLGGKLRKPGQEAAPGWLIVSINVDAGTVLVQNAKGIMHTITLRKPPSEQQPSSQTGGATPRGGELPGPMLAPGAATPAPSLSPDGTSQQGAPVGP